MPRGPGKGKTNNPNGRPKGSKNVVTRKAREILLDIMESRMDSVGAALDELYKDDKYKWLMAIKELMGYVLPKKRDITTDDNAIVPQITINEIQNNE